MTYASIPSSFTLSKNSPWWPSGRLRLASPPSWKMAPLASYVQPVSSYTSCPLGISTGSASITRLDGLNNAASQVTSAQGTGQALYIPLASGQSSSVLRISSSITISKPLVIPCGASFYVDSGKTLTITARPRSICSRFTGTAVFGGPGKVVFKDSAGAEMLPIWFGAYGATAMNAASKSCTGRCTLVFTIPTQLAATVRVPLRVSIFSTAGATLAGDGTFDGLIVSSGNRAASGPIVLASMLYHDSCVRVSSGISNLRLQAGVLQRCTMGIRLDASSASLGGESAVAIFASACGQTDHCVAFYGGDEPQTLNNVAVFVNFDTEGEGSALRIFGNKAPGCTACGAVFQAVDPTPSNPSFVTLLNEASTKLSKPMIDVQTWIGNFASSGSSLPSGQLVQGAFATLQASFALASTDIQNPNVEFSMSGSGNYPSLPYVASAGAIVPLYESQSTAAANPIAGATVIYVSINTGSTAWKSGVTRSYYLSIPFALYSPGWNYVPFRADHNGFVVSSVSVVQTGVYKIDVLFAGSDSVAWTNYVHRFGLQLAA